jgi:hypothetical protein
LRFLIYKSDVPDSVTVWQDAEFCFRPFACFCQVLLEVTNQTEFAYARGYIILLYRCETWSLAWRKGHRLALWGRYRLSPYRTVNTFLLGYKKVVR